MKLRTAPCIALQPPFSEDESRMGERDQMACDVNRYDVVIGRVLYANKTLHLFTRVNAKANHELP